MCIENNSNAQAFLRWASSKLSLENIRIGDLDELVVSFHLLDAVLHD